MVSSGPANKVLRYLSFKKKYCLIKFSKHDTNFSEDLAGESLSLVKKMFEWCLLLLKLELSVSSRSCCRSTECSEMWCRAVLLMVTDCSRINCWWGETMKFENNWLINYNQTLLIRYVWTYNECSHVPHVAKTDDNVMMNVTHLMNVLNTRQDSEKQFIACSVPSRNIATGEACHWLWCSRFTVLK